MKPLVYCFLFALASSIGACQRREPPEQPVPAAPTVSYDLQYIDTALKHHAAAVDMAGIATRKARRQEIVALATSIIDQTNRESSQLGAWRDRWYSGAKNAYDPTFPGAFSMKMDFAPLERQDVADWDLVFLDLMIPHQESMITMATDAQAKAVRPELRKFAAEMLPILQRDVAHMKSLGVQR